MHYNIRDILTAPTRALSAKRIYVMTVFLCVALLVYDLFTYAAIAVEGESLNSYWSVYGLLPLVWLKLSNFMAGLLYGLGLALSILVIMTGFFGVSAIEIEQIRGNHFFSAHKAIKFSLKRFTQLLVTEISIVAFVAVIILLIMLLGLIVRIPVIGEWIYVLTFVLPGFIVAILTVFILFVLVISVLLLPAVSAAERNGEAFTAILETFSTITRQPSRWFVYTVYSVVAAKICSFVYAYFCYRAVEFFTWSASLTAGNKVEKLVRAGLSHLPVRSDVVRETFNIFPGIDWSFSITPWAYGGSHGAAGHGMALVIFLIFTTIIGYALAVIATAQARGYVALRYIKDDYKIADETPLFFEEEHVNEPVEETSADDNNL